MQGKGSEERQVFHNEVDARQISELRAGRGGRVHTRKEDAPRARPEGDSVQEITVYQKFQATYFPSYDSRKIELGLTHEKILMIIY